MHLSSLIPEGPELLPVAAFRVYGPLVLVMKMSLNRHALHDDGLLLVAPGS